MKPPTLGMLAGGAIGLTALVLAVLGAPIDRPPPPPRATSSPSPVTVSAGGITLASTSVDLPADDATYPDGPHADLVNAQCTACHSAAMALTQPALSSDQWKATVTKMREVYHAPVAAEDVPAIVAYLAAMPGQRAASDAEIKGPPRTTG